VYYNVVQTFFADFSRITSWHELAMACGTSKADVSSLRHQKVAHEYYKDKIAHEYYKDARKTARANWLNEQRKAGNAILYKFNYPVVALLISIDLVVVLLIS
jgi:hypothetical protein